MNNKFVNMFLAVVVIVACAYFIATSAWFDLTPCPEGTRIVKTVWTDTDTGVESESNICVQGEE